jgi:pimeloyl-ACP methyl ester carboxylesterase
MKVDSNISAPTRFLQVGNERYAYRRFGNGSGLPLLFLQHFTGTLDNWDPAVTDPLATSNGDACSGFLGDLGVNRCDVLGFSLGGMVAQQMVLERPSIFRRMAAFREWEQVTDERFITLEGDANGAPHPDPTSYSKKFSGKYEHRTITGGVGHNLPQEAPQSFAKAIVDVDRY